MGLDVMAYGSEDRVGREVGERTVASEGASSISLPPGYDRQGGCARSRPGYSDTFRKLEKAGVQGISPWIIGAVTAAMLLGAGLLLVAVLGE